MRLNKIADDLYVPENFERFHHYYADAEGTKEYTGITTILGVIAKPALIGWAAKMAVAHAKDRFAALIKDGKFSYDVATVEEILNEARTAHAKKRDTAAEKGTDLHALVEGYVSDCIVGKAGWPISTTGYEDLAPIAPFIDWAIKEKIRFIAAEQRLYSKTHWLAGTCDLVFEKDGKRFIGDIKTYKKIWDRVPLIQCAGYALMYEETADKVPCSCPNGGRYSDGHMCDKCYGIEWISPTIDGYCVICVPKERAFNEAEDVLWSYDTEGDREAFLSAVRLYRYLKQK